MAMLLLLCAIGWLVGWLVGWLLGGIIEWAMTFRKDGDPFNWRIMIWPPAYASWLDYR